MRFKKLGQIFIYFGLFIIIVTIFTGIRISQYGHQFSDRPSDAAIILGAAIWDDKPSPVFQSRIDHGIDLHKKGTVKYLIFTGGIGKNQHATESEVARKYAITQGVNKDAILIETRSTITFENLEQAKILLDKAELSTVLLISDPLHMKRSMAMARDLNIKAEPSPTPYSLYKSPRKKMGFLAREVLFYLGYLMLG